MAKGKYQEWLTKDSLLLLAGWARDGLTDEELAGRMGIVPSTLYEWKKKYPELSEALKKGKDLVDIEVENALLRSALGYMYDETTMEPLYNPASGEPLKDADGQPIIRVTKIVTKQVQPNPTSLIFWLKNRRGEKWRDRHHTQVSVDTQPMTDEEVDAEIAKLEEELGLGGTSGQE